MTRTRTIATALLTAALVAASTTPALAGTGGGGSEGATVTNISEGTVKVRAWLTNGRQVSIKPGDTREHVAEVNWPRCMFIYKDRGEVDLVDGRGELTDGGYFRVDDQRHTLCH